MSGRWRAELAIGLTLAAVGVVLTLRPFTSLAVLVWVAAAALLLTGAVSIRRGMRDGFRVPVVAGGLWIAAAAAAVLWPDVTIRILAVVVGVAMVLDGIIDVADGVTGPDGRRLASVVGGIASAVLGVLALAWPDVTLLVVAVVFGARTVLLGLRTAWSALRERDPDRGPAAAGADAGAEEAEPPGPLRRAGHLVGVSIALVLALVLATVSVAVNRRVADVDAFYDTPDDVPASPGRLLDSDEVTAGIPDGARARRILYTTTRDEDRPAVASALVVVPEGADGPLPVVAWAHGTTGVARRCAPTVMDAGLEAGAFFVLDEVIDRGWALVATDYVGLGTEGPHPYLVGQGQARSVLDAVRAARDLPAADLADETVVWGHSQGGGAALWTSQVAPTYAPDVPLSGVAALAPAADLGSLVDALTDITGGSVFAAYVASAYAAEYDDLAVGDLVRPTARTTFDQTIGRCLDATALASILSSVATGFDMFRRDVVDRLRPHLEANTPTGPFGAPVLVAQGAADTLITADVQERYVADLCAAGRSVAYRSYAGLGHVPLVEADSPLVPDLLAWTDDRLAGRPVEDHCPAR